MVKLIGSCIAKLNLPAIYEAEQFAISKLLAVNFEQLQAEWLAFYSKNYNQMPAIQTISGVQKELTAKNDWQTVFIYGYGQYFKNTISAFPVLHQILEQFPEKKAVFFSILQPGKSLKKHKGHYAGLLRLHLGIDVQEPEKITLFVENTPLFWENGKVIVFDDSREHEVVNAATKPRVVLIIDFERSLPIFYKLLNKLGLFFLQHSAYVKSAKAKASALRYN